MQGAVNKSKWGWPRIEKWIRLCMNMLHDMNHGKEKVCPDGMKIFWIMYLGSNCNEGTKKKIEEKNLVPPLWSWRRFGAPFGPLKKTGPHFDHPEKILVPPQKDGPLPVKSDSCFSRWAHFKAKLHFFLAHDCNKWLHMLQNNHHNSFRNYCKLCFLKYRTPWMY